MNQFCYAGCLKGFIGCLPLYLKVICWAPAGADGDLAALNGPGMVASHTLLYTHRQVWVEKGDHHTCVLFGRHSSGLQLHLLGGPYGDIVVDILFRPEDGRGKGQEVDTLFP